jgi:hypothetical protein
MNTQAIAVERVGRRVLMSGLHGSWSIGSFAGAGIGALAVGAGLGLTPQLLILGTIALLGAGLLTSRMLPDAIERPGADERPIGRPAAAIAGFAFLGIGLASVIPAVFSAAGRIAGLHPGTAVATVSACGWTGFVCGPPLIGHLASLASLSLALGLLPFLTMFVAVGTLLSRALRDAPQGPASPARSDGTP